MIRLYLNICKIFHEIKHINFNDYDTFLVLSANLSADSFSCPSCKAPHKLLTHNGGYKRHLVFIDNEYVLDKLLDIKVYKCISCNKSHSLLPSIIVPYSSYSINFIINLFYSYLTKRFNNVPQLCEHYDITERTFYRIKNRFFMDSHFMNILLNTLKDFSSTINTLFHLENVYLHSFLDDFFQSCGYSFMQPLIKFRQNILTRGSPIYSIK